MGVNLSRRVMLQTADIIVSLDVEYNSWGKMDEQVSFTTIDCASISLDIPEGNVSDVALKAFGEQLISVLKVNGVCYFKNFGIDKDLLDDFMAISRNFFLKPDEVKAKIRRPEGKNFGWIPDERANNQRPYDDLKETFNYCPGQEPNTGDWPDTQFKQCKVRVFETFVSFSKRLLDALSLALGQDKSFFAQAHKTTGKLGNHTTLRSAYYPPVLGESSVKPGQTRCGEHTDFGTITLLFQDAGGLQVDIPGQGFVSVPPIPNTLVVLACDLLQRWTADSIKAPNHRVTIPETELEKRSPRQSLIFFVMPDDDCEIKPLDGSNKYKPIICAEFLVQRYYDVGAGQLTF